MAAPNFPGLKSWGRGRWEVGDRAKHLFVVPVDPQQVGVEREELFREPLPFLLGGGRQGRIESRNSERECATSKRGRRVPGGLRPKREAFSAVVPGALPGRSDKPPRAAARRGISGTPDPRLSSPGKPRTLHSGSGGLGNRRQKHPRT